MSKFVNHPRREWAAAVVGAVILCGCGRTLPPAGSTPAVPPSPTPVPGPSYAEVIPAGAVTKSGLFKVHRVGEKLYFEIPRRELGQELLLARVGGGWSGRGIPAAVVVFQQAGNRLLLRQRSYETRADSGTPIHQAVARRNEVIIATLDIQAVGPDSAAVVDVTSFLPAA